MTLSASFPLALLATTLWRTASCQGTTVMIIQERDFYDFSLAVNQGRDYSGTTVYLDSDLDLANYSSKFTPIGHYYGSDSDACTFRGTFDGLGHTISNLRFSIPSSAVGVFAVSEGMTIRNLVLDSSCSVNSFYNSQLSIHAGGIVGTCSAAKGNCVIENTVNMANVSFTGYSGDNGVSMGGIAGSLLALDGYSAVVKNCANFGDVSFSGISDSWEYVGGLVGECSSRRSEEEGCAIRNSVNYGVVSYSAASSPSDPSVGGLVGHGRNASIENCVSAGRIQTAPGVDAVGSVMGTAGEGLYTNVTHSFWMKDVGVESPYGARDLLFKAVHSEAIEDFTQGVLDELNKYAWESGGAAAAAAAGIWLKLHTNGGTVCGIAREVLATIQNKFVTPIKEGHTFRGWYRDAECTSRYDSEKDGRMQTTTDLYAKYVPNTYTVTFNPVGGLTEMVSKRVVFGNQYGELPTPRRNGYTFMGWFMGMYGTLDQITAETRVATAGDHTLYASYAQKAFPINFDPGEGAVSFRTKNVTLKESYGELPRTERVGHSFDGWYTKKNGKGDRVSPDSIVRVAENATLYANWLLNMHTLIFDLGNGTKIRQSIGYNETVAYPALTDRGHITFMGWDKSIRYMPDRDVTVRSLWKNTVAVGVVTAIGWIVASVLGVTFLAFIFTMLSVFSRTPLVKAGGKKEGKEEGKKDELFKDKYKGVGMGRAYSRILDSALEEFGGRHRDTGFGRRRSGSDSDYEEDDDDYETGTYDYDNLYPQNYKPPSMKEALVEAGLSEKDAGDAVKACSRLGEGARVFGSFTRKDAEAVALYTFDFGARKFEMNPYRIVNKALTGSRGGDEDDDDDDDDEGEIRRVRGLLYVMMSALRKLPRVAGRMLYRGTREQVDKSRYREGRIVVWPGLSSTSLDINTTKKLLSKGRSPKAGTLFIIEDGWGYDLQPYSLFPGDEEILLEPGRCFRVKGVIESETTIIHLQMLDTPLILPQVFGAGPK